LGIIPKLSWGRRRRLRRRYHRENNAVVKVRVLVVSRLSEGATSVDIERSGLCVRSTVSYVAERFRSLGDLGLEDGRRFNGSGKLSETVLIRLAELIRDTPQRLGWRRPTWTRELMALQLERDTGIRLSVTTLSRLLRRMGIRWGRPKLFVECPWSQRRRRRRLAQIRTLVENLGPDEVALYEDEVDIHLNPKPGPDWMPHGVQKWVRTPGQNKKCYLAGALNLSTGLVAWTEGEHKRSQLFIDLLDTLVRRYRRCRRIHLILDNYSIHKSRITRAALQRHRRRVVLHFLPPFCPDENLIERLWRDLHANVTRNHRCRSIEELMGEVRSYLKAAQPYPGNKPSIRPAA
jgi:transposase